MLYIRYATVEDARVLGRIHCYSWKAAYRNIVPDNVLDKISEEKRYERFKKALTEGLEEDAILFEENIAVGFICIGKCRDKDMDDTCGEVWGIYLLPSCTRKGMGYELMKWGLEELKKKGYKKATLWVLEENKGAINFYEKMGFRYEGTTNDITIGKVLKECRYIKDI